MIDPHPEDPINFKKWAKQLVEKWQAGLIPDPQCVAIIVTNDQGNVLLQQRDNNPNISFPNYWTLPGGVVNPNENPEQAAQREIFEETGLQLKLSHWKVYKRVSPNNDPTIEQHVFIGITQKEVGEMILGEGQALQFFKREDVQALPIAFDFDKLLVEFFVEKNGAG